MKKIIIVIIAIITLYSCAKKSTPTSAKVDSVVSNQVTPAEDLPVLPKVRPSWAARDSSMKAEPKEMPVGAVEPTRETAQIETGKIVYKTKCGKCHNLRDPQEFDAAKWVKIVDWMAPKAQLSTVEKENVLAFVSLYAKR
jgi:mono/diheme cytochrome c family protein